MDIAAETGGLISQQCLTLLLMITGIKPNPGPDNKKQKAIIVQLCADAQSVEIRNCIRLYNCQNSYRRHCSELEKCSKPVIVSTLDYLEMPGQNQYNKNICVNSRICHIQKFLPDQCGFCGQTYCVKLGDKPFL